MTTNWLTPPPPPTCSPSSTWVRQKLNPPGFSRTHVDDWTHPTGCTQTPGHQSREPRRRDRRMCTTSTTPGHQTDRSPMVQDVRCRPTPIPGWFSFSRDDTHRPGGATFGSERTAISEPLLRRSGGLPVRLRAVTTTSCRAAFNHHQVPQARVIQAMEPGAGYNPHEEWPAPRLWVPAILHLKLWSLVLQVPD